MLRRNAPTNSFAWAPPGGSITLSLFHQLENRNRVAERKPHLEIATRGDGDVLDAIHHIRNGRRVDTRTQVEPPELRAARSIKRVKISVALSHEHKVAGRGQRAANQRLFSLVLPGNGTGVHVDGAENSILQRVLLHV